MAVMRDRRQPIGGEKADIGGIIARRKCRIIVAMGTVDHQNPGAAWVVGIVINAENAIERNLNPDLLERLAARSLLGGLVGLLEAAGQTPQPAPRLVASSHQQNLPASLDEHTTGNLWINISHKATAWAGWPHAPTNSALSQLTPAARAVVQRPPLWIDTHVSDVKRQATFRRHLALLDPMTFHTKKGANARL
jgi:hypothetical protein